MSDANDIRQWPERIRQRYENYLKTSFYFKDPSLRESFQAALKKEDSLLKGPFPEPTRGFKQGLSARALAQECFPGRSEGLLPALIERRLYVHQERAVRATHLDQRNIVVATGTASGKTESFLYPILFELYRQHLTGELRDPGVRAMILYPMNALANDQRERLGSICTNLCNARSGFQPTFGQYIGQTPEDEGDARRNAAARAEDRWAGELVFRTEMRSTPPHILLTNYSMLEYLLIRPDDSPLFDGDRGKHWQFTVLDEAHQYRGAKGMEMGMLMRRLKQRLRDGGRQSPFRCVATSATLSSGEGKEDKKTVAEFAGELFGESFSESGVIFGESEQVGGAERPQRYHAYLRALEGAFIVHREGADSIVLNRKGEMADSSTAEPLEIALCRECGQYYFVGREIGGKLQEAVRDPSQSDFGVDYYLPTEDEVTHVLCRCCGALSTSNPTCDCGAAIRVKKCKPTEDRPDQIKQCETCGYKRGGIGDPVQEIVHGSDGPNSVIATALHELLPEDRRRVLTFADSRQDAAFFAWYAEDSYEKVRDRNLMLRAMREGLFDPEGLSIDDLRNRLLKQWEKADLFGGADTKEGKFRKILTAILREALTDERRLSLSGVGLVRWSVKIPDNLTIPEAMRQSPWNLTDKEAHSLLGYLLDELRLRFALEFPDDVAMPLWKDVSPQRTQTAFMRSKPGGAKDVREWGSTKSAVVSHFLYRLLKDSGLTDDENRAASSKLMKDTWKTLRERDQKHGSTGDPILTRGIANGTFRLNSRWLRINLTDPGDVWECDTCTTLSTHNIRGVCPRNGCPGNLAPADHERLGENHYRILYESVDLPPSLRAEEHTAQIESDEARQRQVRFKNQETHLLSSSTTFEIGVDLGDLDAVFLRNVPPEPFNYTQRVGRAGRRETPGLALTYCRRNPHDLYHYEEPVDRLIEGRVHPPRLQMRNEKIILRHMVAAAMSAFFKAHATRFENVASFVGDWSKPCAVSDLKRFCGNHDPLRNSLKRIVPRNMHERIGLTSNDWIDKIAGTESRLADIEAEVCADYCEMESLRKHYFEQGMDRYISRVGKRMKTIAEERALNFLSRKAIIPKYGFPVDVVELETRSVDGNRTGVSLQRDLSQAIAEYAPGGKVVANKLEWESCGVKVVAGKAFPIRHYHFDDARNFTQWNEDDPSAPSGSRKYLTPMFGFVTPLFKKPTEPHRRVQRMYTTRPFFRGFDDGVQLEANLIHGVHVTKATPGTLVILCEGRTRKGFYICRTCGAHMAGTKGTHKSPSDSKCPGTLERFSLGHELVTDVVRLQFPRLTGEWDAYSVAYAVLLGAAETLDVPDTDLNVTITGGSAEESSAAIVLYDNVPGGAGLVAQLELESVFTEMLCNALDRLQGKCGCDSSCYGCLRSYRNQFAHPHLDRKQALAVLDACVARKRRS